jgi:hypothetical protein
LTLTYEPEARKVLVEADLGRRVQDRVGGLTGTKPPVLTRVAARVLVCRILTAGKSRSW